MNTTVEEMRKRMDEICEKNDAFLAEHLPNYDPEKAKATREKLRKFIDEKRNKTSSEETASNDVVTALKRVTFR